MKIIETPKREKPAQAKPGNWLARLFSARSEQKTTFDLSRILDYLKEEDLVATAQELHRLLPGTREIRWPIEALDPYLILEPKAIRERILIEILSRHSQAALSFADDSPSSHGTAPEKDAQPNVLLTLFFTF